MRAPHPMWGQRVRGLVLGLALGDALGSARPDGRSAGPLRVGVSTQLAAFTIEGLIRASVRGHHKGICHPASVLWHAYSRWAALQGIEPAHLASRWATGDPWPDGWLAQVPALAERRGSAPTTVAAVTRMEPGTLESPASTSAGCHALLRVLPAAAMSVVWDREQLADQVIEYAALTHGDADAQWASRFGVAFAVECSRGTPLPEAFMDTRLVDMGSYVGRARDLAWGSPGDAGRLAEVAPRATALSALCGAVYVTHSFPEPEQALDALRFAATAPDGDSVAAVTGALLGAAHGVDVWPVELLARLELTWVLDTLARDLVLQLTDNPAGGEHEAPRDPGWWKRYPGW